MKLKIALSTLLISVASLTLGAATPTKTPVNGYPSFAIGGDLSWTNRIEAAGTPKYYKGPSVASGLTTIPDMVSDYGLDAVRLRVWVNPSTPKAKNGFSFSVGGTSYTVSGTKGYCDAADMLSMAQTFASRGQRVMVCFHLSDTWADPARQFIPADWANCTTVEALKAKVVNHITEVLTMLHDANINVAWVQIGNETNTGMLKYNLPSTSGAEVVAEDYGCAISTSNAQGTKNFVEVFRAGAEAARSMYPDAKIVLHLADGHYWNSVNWTMNQLKRNGFSADFCDYVGLSLYPVNSGANYDKTALWQTDADNCLQTVSNLMTIYGFRALLCEIGMNNEWSESTSATSQKANINQCNADVEAFVSYLFANLKDNNSSTCDGLFYWEPEMDYLDDYKKGACYDFEGNWKRQRVTANPFWSVCRDNSTFPDGGLADFEFSGIDLVPGDGLDVAPVYYNLQGVRVSALVDGAFYLEKRGNSVKKIIYRNR